MYDIRVKKTLIIREKMSKCRMSSWKLLKWLRQQRTKYPEENVVLRIIHNRRTKVWNQMMLVKNKIMNARN